MDTIHLKTVDPLSQVLLKSASQRGIKLNWDRYERLQPQDGFLRVGLSCPYGCMQGPCRIDPFGRGPDRGLCGLDRDRMVAALFLRVVLNGTLEAMNEVAGPTQTAEISLPRALDKILSSAAKKLGGQKLSFEEVSRSASYLDRPMEPPEVLVLQALRLGIMSLGLPGKRKIPKSADRILSVKVGYGLLAQKGFLIGICGRPSPGILEGVRKEASRNIPGGGRFVSLGDWVPSGSGFLPFACTSGEAEMVLSSGKIHLLIAGPGTDPSTVELCQSLNIPLISSQDPKKALKIIRQASQKAEVSSGSSFSPDPSLVEETGVFAAPQQWEEYFTKKAANRLALLGGADHVQQSLGWIPAEVGSALQAEGYGVASWGDAALWMIKKGLASPKYKLPVRILDDQQGPILALKALGGSRRLKQLKGICFAGLKSCQDLAIALGLASLGLRVCVAIPLPLWGSERVRNLLQEELASQGGSLAHFDHPAQAQEILDWFTK
jgi:hypothetical protein